MSEMVDRVALALHPALKTFGPVAREIAILAAIRAIKAMREPTDTMCDAPADAGNKHRAKAIWKGMIDEALR